MRGNDQEAFVCPVCGETFSDAPCLMYEGINISFMYHLIIEKAKFGIRHEAKCLRKIVRKMKRCMNKSDKILKEIENAK
jgi:hypothetical protein